MLGKNFYHRFWCFCVFNIFMGAESAISEKEIKEEMPSTVQQRKMIDTGKELCSYLREVVTAEAQESENAVQKDVELMIENSKKQLKLQEDNFALRVSCSNNNVNSIEFLGAVPHLVRDAETSLAECGVAAGGQASVVADRIRTDVLKLERKGLEILDKFVECSRKGSWSMFACYKRAVSANLAPMKEFVTETVKAHSRSHNDFLTLRRNAAECIQDRLEEFGRRMEALFTSHRI